MRSASITQPAIRDQILGIAEQLFREFGYSKTTVADIAQRCDMSPANVYRFFESKSALNEAITERVLEEQEALARAILRENRSASDRLRKLILEMHNFARERFLHDHKVHELCTRAIEEQWCVIDRHAQRIRAMVRGLIDEGIRSGEFSVKNLDTAEACVNNSMIPFLHPQVVAQQFTLDKGHQAMLMGNFLVAALSSEPTKNGSRKMSSEEVI